MAKLKICNNLHFLLRGGGDRSQGPLMVIVNQEFLYLDPTMSHTAWPFGVGDNEGPPHGAQGIS